MHERKQRLALLLTAVLGPCLFASDGPELDPHRWWSGLDREGQVQLEEQMLALPRAASLRHWHDLFSSELHVAGTAGDARLIERMSVALAEMGLEVERQELLLYLPQPVSARLEILSWPPDAAPEDGQGPLLLPLREDAVEGDPYSADPDLSIGWNAYSGSGVAVGEVVYVNHGTKKDFALLADRDISLAGRIAIARYGGNYRGYKAKFAEEAGAVGLIIFTDPRDVRHTPQSAWPVGGGANDSYIQRGSILTLPWSGDPLTPFVAATKDAERLDPQEVALPKIPVQPVGWRAAREILVRMRGPESPKRWQGGLGFPYRFTGGADLQVRLEVEQTRELLPTANVVARLEGALYPEQEIVIGCHFDAWTFGAGDPNAGSIVLFECARSFAEAARAGWRPARTLVFGNWAAEEQGIIGSCEYCEGHRDRLSRCAVAYINLDMAAMGPRFGASAAPMLKSLILDAAHVVPQCRNEEGLTLYESWSGGAHADAETRPVPSLGNLGGGSDHVGFYCHLGIPSCSMSAGGSPGVSYHSAYENLAWYRSVVGEDYEPALMVTRMVNTVVARLAEAHILPLDPAQIGRDLDRHLSDLENRAKAYGIDWPEKAGASLRQRCQDFLVQADPVQTELWSALEENRLPAAARQAINHRLLNLERQWLRKEGLPERPWFRNLFAATDPDSGYAAWMLPGLRHAVERRSPELLIPMLDEYEQVVVRLSKDLTAIQSEIPGGAEGSR